MGDRGWPFRQVKRIHKTKRNHNSKLRPAGEGLRWEILGISCLQHLFQPDFNIEMATKFTTMGQLHPAWKRVASARHVQISCGQTQQTSN